MSKKRKKSPGASIEKRKKTAKDPPPKTFFDLPAEIRNEIYDMTVTPFIKEQKASSYPLGRQSNGGPRIISRLSTPALSKVCRQMRHEFLPVYHRHMVLNLDWNFTWNAEFSESWLDIFGESRVPLTRRFALGIIPHAFNGVLINLNGGLHVSWSRGYGRGQEAPECWPKVREFVESQLQHGEAGQYLTVDGVRAIVKFASEIGKK